LTRRTLIVSEFNAKDKAHFALSYEFCRIVTECDDADLIAPGIDNYLARRLNAFLPPHDGHNVQRDFNRMVNGFRKGLGLKNAATIEPVQLEQDYDLFFFVAWSPQSLVELTRIPNWRGRCKIAVAYLFELWSSTLEQDRRYLKLLDQFDHVFLLHSASIPRLPSYTRAPCSFLPTGVDCTIASPCPSPPDRVVDVYSIGNRAAQLHRQLVAMTERRGLFYLYDSLSSTDSQVKDWREHRLLLANIIKRSRYFMCFSPATLAYSKTNTIQGEQVLPARLFEGAAGGAVMLGTAPQCAEFRECFDWPDAVIEVHPESTDIAAVIDDLDAQPERTERVRRTGVTRCLQRHDWVYRWEHILSTVGMEPLPQLHRRKAKLREIAASMLTTSPQSGGADAQGVHRWTARQ
jgi:Glycosyl transferases group 1